jgi:hypothetical protein
MSCILQYPDQVPEKQNYEKQDYDDTSHDFENEQNPQEDYNE